MLVRKVGSGLNIRSDSIELANKDKVLQKGPVNAHRVCKNLKRRQF